MLGLDLPYGFLEGPRFADDLNKVEVERDAQDELLRALQSLLLHGKSENVSHPLGDDTDICYVRSREFPFLEMPPLYMTFRIEAPGRIELRRIFTEADVRAGLHLELDA